MPFSPSSLSKPIFFGSFSVTQQVRTRTGHGISSLVLILLLRQVFYLTNHSFALVNIKPILPGHVLVSPIRRVARFHELTADEVSDLFLTVQKVGRMVERAFKASALNIAIQDGSDAGQSVPHVHAHIIPRRAADLPNVDDIYKEMDGAAGNVGQHQSAARDGSFPAVDPDREREPRSKEVMNEEAAWLAKEMDQEEGQT